MLVRGIIQGMSEAIGGNWFRRDDPGVHRGRLCTEVRYTWSTPTEHNAMMICVTPEGLHLTNNKIPLRSEQDLEGIERVLLVAHRQYVERLLAGMEPHPVQDDAALYDWLGQA